MPRRTRSGHESSKQGGTLVSRPFTAHGIRHRVLEGGSGPSVILLHELPGITAAFRELAKWLMASGFRVHVPVLYGRDDGTVRRGPAALWCLRKELSAFAVGKQTPLASWVRALVQDIAQPHARRVGVVGMCMTGAGPPTPSGRIRPPRRRSLHAAGP